MMCAGCKREEIEVYRIPKPPVASGPIKYQLPAGWSELPPAKMSVALFSVADHKAELSVMSFPGEGASQLSLINVVRDTSGLPPLSDAELAKLTEPVTVGGDQGSLVNLTGSTGTSPSAASNSVLVAVVPHEGVTWFFKMIGSPEAVAAQKPELLDFLKSVSFMSGGEMPSPHTEMPATADTGQMPSAASAGLQDTSSSADKPAWTIPTVWREVPPTEMLLAKFVVAGQGGEANVTVSMFPGDVGGTLANINRWRKQVALPAVDEAGLDKAFTPLDVPNGKAMLVDLSGQSKGGKDTRLVGVIWPRNGQTWFYKLMGDSAAAGGAKDDFLKFIQSVRYPNG